MDWEHRLCSNSVCSTYHEICTMMGESVENHFQTSPSIFCTPSTMYAQFVCLLYVLVIPQVLVP